MTSARLTARRGIILRHGLGNQTSFGITTKTKYNRNQEEALGLCGKVIRNKPEARP